MNISMYSKYDFSFDIFNSTIIKVNYIYNTSKDSNHDGQDIFLAQNFVLVVFSKRIEEPSI